MSNKLREALERAIAQMEFSRWHWAPPASTDGKRAAVEGLRAALAEHDDPAGTLLYTSPTHSRDGLTTAAGVSDKLREALAELVAADSDQIPAFDEGLAAQEVWAARRAAARANAIAALSESHEAPTKGKV